MNVRRLALALLFPWMLSTPVRAQMGQVDQRSPAANSSYNTTLPSLTWQQQIEAGIGGVLEGFELTSTGTIGGSFDVSLRLGPLTGPSAPLWSATFVRASTLEETPYFDVTSADLRVSPGDKFVLEVTGNGVGACDLRGSASPALYGEPLWLNGSSVGNSVFAFRTWVLETTGTHFCSATPNSTGLAATLSAFGSASVAANDIELASGPGPIGRPGIFLAGPNEIMIPFGDGFRCVGGSILRLQPPVTHDATGVMTRALDVANLPNGMSIAAGEVVKFQAWFRDPAAGGAGFNLSDGVSVFFVP